MYFLFVNKQVELPQVVPVDNAKPDQITPTADFQLFANPSFIVFNAFAFNNKAFCNFGRGETVGNVGYHIPFAVSELK